MKKIMLAVVCVLAIAGCKQKGQTEGNADGVDSLDSLKADTAVVQPAKCTPEDIEVDWANKEIVVEKGGQKPDIIKLLQAFNAAWPTEAVCELLDMAKDPNLTEKGNDETGGLAVVDRNSGYVQLIHGDAPGDNVTAAMWNRKDGDRLFIINIVRPGREEGTKDVQAICAYDYEPNSQTLRPERNAIIRFRQTADMTTTYQLPREGRDVSIVERDKDFNGTFHIFAWDGQNFSKESSVSEQKLTKMLNGTWTCHEEGKPMLTFKITNDVDTYCGITDCVIPDDTEYDAAANAYDGFLHLYEASAPDETTFNSSIKCKFKLCKDGKLRGTCFLRQTDGKEFKGEMTLDKDSELHQYAE